jgi:hypothetical protein
MILCPFLEALLRAQCSEERNLDSLCTRGKYAVEGSWLLDKDQTVCIPISPRSTLNSPLEHYSVGRSVALYMQEPEFQLEPTYSPQGVNV